MKRRDALKGLLAGLAAHPALSSLAAQAVARGAGTLFPTNLPYQQWVEFPAEGFSHPACGLIYNQLQPPRQGMALGGIDTGYMSLEVDGTLGYCTVFNSIDPQRGPLALPLLGMSVGDDVWMLAAPRSTFGEYTYIPGRQIQTAARVHYWGHYPVVDMEFEMPGSPVSAGVRAWSPFLPGDSATSNTPGAVFDVHLRNVSKTRQEGRLAFMFPGPTQAEAQITNGSPRVQREHPHIQWVATAPKPTRALRQQVRGDFTGLVVTSEAVKEIGYAIGVVGDAEVNTGGGLVGGASAGTPEGEPPETSYHRSRVWVTIPTALPEAKENDFTGSVSLAYQLNPGEEKTIRFVLAWMAPMWIGEGPHTFIHKYTERFKSALEVAQFVSRNHDSLLGRVLGWQDVIFGERQLPVWLREALINILYLFPVNSLWATMHPPIGPWCDPKDGLFGMIDGLVEDPGMEPLPDTFYANAPIVYFFPDLAHSTLRGYKAYQFTNGQAPWVFGGIIGGAKGGYEPTAGTEMASPSPGYQSATTGPSYVDMVDRYWQRTGDAEFLKEFYPSVKSNTIFTMSLRHGDGEGNVISVPDGNQDPNRATPHPGILLEWFEWVQWFGMASHVGGIHLATLRMAERMAEKYGDQSFARQCKDWIAQGSHAMETQMWDGSYYLPYYEVKTGKKSDDIFAYQLDGDWMAKFHGLAPVFRPDRAKTTLDTIAKTCARLTPYGATNFAHPDGSYVEDIGYGPNTFFVPEVYMLAMTYMYAGEREFGLELARRCVRALIDNGGEWNQPNMIRGDTGIELFGSHYDQNMMLWAIPAALEGKDIAAACAPGGLVDRVIQAARKA